MDLLGQSGVFGAVDPMKRGFLLARAASDEAEILTLAVDPAHRRQGIARDLVTCALGACPDLGAARLFLEVAADNPAALALYDSLGFAEIGRRKRYYPRPNAAAVDAVVMRRAVPPMAAS